jgi:hypothetical protein
VDGLITVDPVLAITEQQLRESESYNRWLIGTGLGLSTVRKDHDHVNGHAADPGGSEIHFLSVRTRRFHWPEAAFSC